MDKKSLNIENLPIELKSKIMSNLPVKDINNLRLASKSFSNPYLFKFYINEKLKFREVELKFDTSDDFFNSPIFKKLGIDKLPYVIEDFSENINIIFKAITNDDYTYIDNYVSIYIIYMENDVDNILLITCSFKNNLLNGKYLATKKRILNNEIIEKFLFDYNNGIISKSIYYNNVNFNVKIYRKGKIISYKKYINNNIPLDNYIIIDNYDVDYILNQIKHNNFMYEPLNSIKSIKNVKIYYNENNYITISQTDDNYIIYLFVLSIPIQNQNEYEPNTMSTKNQIFQKEIIIDKITNIRIYDYIPEDEIEFFKNIIPDITIYYVNELFINNDVNIIKPSKFITKNLKNREIEVFSESYDNLCKNVFVKECRLDFIDINCKNININFNGNMVQYNNDNVYIDGDVEINGEMEIDDELITFSCKCNFNKGLLNNEYEYYDNYKRYFATYENGINVKDSYLIKNNELYVYKYINGNLNKRLVYKSKENIDNLNTNLIKDNYDLNYKIKNVLRSINLEVINKMIYEDINDIIYDNNINKEVIYLNMDELVYYDL